MFLKPSVVTYHIEVILNTHFMKSVIHIHFVVQCFDCSLIFFFLCVCVIEGTEACSALKEWFDIKASSNSC